MSSRLNETDMAIYLVSYIFIALLSIGMVITNLKIASNPFSSTVKLELETKPIIIISLTDL